MISSEMKECPKFSIALVNYQTFDLTKICLNLLKKHIDAGLLVPNKVDIGVVDNDSKDESTDYLRTLDWINLIERKPVGQETGFAAHGRG